MDTADERLTADREEFLRSFCQAAVARANAQAEEIDWDSLCSDEESEHASQVYELSWRETIEKDAEAKEELDKLRDQGDELIVGLDQERRELQRVWDRTMLKREHRRRDRIFKLYQARTNLLHRRRSSSERRPPAPARAAARRRPGPDHPTKES